MKNPLEGTAGTVPVRFRDGTLRTYDMELGCWVRHTAPSPAPDPEPVPEGHRSWTPKQLASRALAEGRVHLAACFLEQGEGCSL